MCVHEVCCECTHRISAKGRGYKAKGRVVGAQDEGRVFGAGKGSGFGFTARY
jgi:hypothetical protein